MPTFRIKIQQPRAFL
ncbi:hypothetical protein D043_1851A, partial [Vibrio parahaemolyticus EKP-021]